MKVRKYILISSLLFLFATGLLVAEGFKVPYAIKGCQVVNPDGTVITNATVVIRDGIIKEVGPAEKVKIPPDAEVIDGKDYTVYPGFIDAFNVMLVRIKAKKEKKKEETPRRRGWLKGKKTKALHPERELFKYFSIKKTTLKKYLKAGITTVHIGYEEEILPGKTAVINLNGKSIERALVVPQLFLQVNFNPQMDGYPTSLMGVGALLRQMHLDVRHYYTERLIYSRYKDNPRPAYDEAKESLIPYFLKGKKVLFLCKDLVEFRLASRIAKDTGWNWAFVTSPEIWRVKEQLKRVPVIVSLNYTPPSRSIYSRKSEKLKKEAKEKIFPAALAELNKAKIPFALSSYGLSSPKEFLQNLRKAVKAGLDKKVALKAVTENAARLLGLEEVLGSVEKGKIANLILAKGDIFEDKTKIAMVFVDGEKFDFSKEAELKPPAGNVTGTWKVKVSSQMGEFNMRWHLKQEGNEITGTIEMGGSTWRIPEGTISGKEITLTIEGTSPGGAFTITFNGTVEGDKIIGTLSMGTYGEAEVIATKEPEEGLS